MNKGIPGPEFLGIDDPDQPIYRVIDYNYLKSMYLNRELVLVRPRLWDDPFENVLLKLRVRSSVSGEQIGLRDVLDVYFGQCWSSNAKETDATWRIYSPGGNGVRISSTPRKLIGAITASGAWQDSMQVIVGRVRYQTADEIFEQFCDPKVLRQICTSWDGVETLQTFLVKRLEFEHECEVRVLLRDRRHSKALHEKTLHVDVNPHELVDTLLFDPRMPEQRFATFRMELEYHGVAMPISHSELYKLPDRELLIDLDGIEMPQK